MSRATNGRGAAPRRAGPPNRRDRRRSVAREASEARETREARDARDQQETAFTPILRDLVRRIPGTRAAALVDFEGETVDYHATRVAPFDVRVAAAHGRLVLDEAMHEWGGPGALSSIAVRAGRRSFLFVRLPEGYALVLVFSRGAGFGGWHRAVDACVHDLTREAGWSAAAVDGEEGTSRPPWVPVEVVCDGRGRPQSVSSRGRGRPVEILGLVVGVDPQPFPKRERSWRIRFDSGLEATLVREAGGSWYVDESFEAEPVPTPTRTRTRTG